MTIPSLPERDAPGVPAGGARAPRLLVGSWLVAVSAGFALLYAYVNAPGAAASPPADWPAGTRVARSEAGWDLVMLAHPRCPCTRASLRELARLVAQAEERVAVHVLFYRPEDAEDGWERTDLWASAAAIPGVEVLADEEGLEAQRFGASTSGQVVLYDPDGRVAFSGGITPARGHSGDSTGRRSILSLVTGGESAAREAFVFGCPIRVEEAQAR